MKILVIEDCDSLLELLQDHLRRCGFAVDAASTGKQGIESLQTCRYDAVILDLGLPDMEGIEVLAACHSMHATPIPCLVLTARDALQSRVACLNAGADDYILKPFSVEELEARIRAVLRRSGTIFHALVLANLRFEPESRHAVVDDKVLDLPRREAMLLEEMLRVSPRIVVKEWLEERLYSHHESVTLNAIEALIYRLRKKLAASGASVVIDTVRGVGYRLVSSQSNHA